MDLMATGSAEAQATLEGVRVGAIVTLAAAVIGQLLAPLLHDVVKRWADRRAEARAERKVTIRAVQALAQQIGLTAINQPNDRAGWSEDYRKAVLEFMVSVNAITLGIGNAADFSLRTALLRMPNRFEKHGSPMHLWTLIGGNLVDLNELIDKPRRYQKVIDAMDNYMEADARKQGSIEGDGDLEHRQA